MYVTPKSFILCSSEYTPESQTSRFVAKHGERVDRGVQGASPQCAGRSRPGSSGERISAPSQLREVEGAQSKLKHLPFPTSEIRPHQWKRLLERAVCASPPDLAILERAWRTHAFHDQHRTVLLEMLNTAVPKEVVVERRWDADNLGSFLVSLRECFPQRLYLPETCVEAVLRVAAIEARSGLEVFATKSRLTEFLQNQLDWQKVQVPASINYDSRDAVLKFSPRRSKRMRDEPE